MVEVTAGPTPPSAPSSSALPTCLQPCNAGNGKTCWDYGNTSGHTRTYVAVGGVSPYCQCWTCLMACLCTSTVCLHWGAQSKIDCIIVVGVQHTLLMPTGFYCVDAKCIWNFIAGYPAKWQRERRSREPALAFRVINHSAC